MPASASRITSMLWLDSCLPLRVACRGQYAWGRNIDPETNTYNNVTTFNNYYQLYAELNVFDGFATINALKQAKLSRDYSATAMQKIQDDRAIDVMQNMWMLPMLRQAFG